MKILKMKSLKRYIYTDIKNKCYILHTIYVLYLNWLKRFFLKNITQHKKKWAVSEILVDFKLPFQKKS